MSILQNELLTLQAAAAVGSDSLSNHSVEATDGAATVNPWRVFAPRRHYGLYAVDTLAPHWIVKYELTYYFHHLIHKLKSIGYTEGYTLFATGYDWRQVRVLSRRAVRGSVCVCAIDGGPCRFSC